MKPEYWGKILNREKSVEFRLLNQYLFKKVVLSGEWQTKLAVFKSKDNQAVGSDCIVARVVGLKKLTPAAALAAYPVEGTACDVTRLFRKAREIYCLLCTSKSEWP